jgi:cell division protein FtsZ
VYNITGGSDLTLQEINTVSEVITSLADPTANIIFGAVVDDQYKGELQVTLIATGFATPSSINAGQQGGNSGGPPPPTSPNAGGGGLPWQREGGARRSSFLDNYGR